MQPPECRVQYSQGRGGDQDEVSMAAASSPGEAPGSGRSSWRQRVGIVLKTAGGVTLFWAVFALGYVTSYYIHRCT